MAILPFSRPTALLLLLAAAGCAPAAAPITRTPTPVIPVATATLQTDTVRARPYDTGRMWTFDFPPTEYLQQTYGFAPDTAWFNTVRRSSLKFATWCSASFVSADGLIMTNHHCAVPILDDVQRTGEDLMTNGFYARTQADERPVPGLFVEQLVSMEDVTEAMNGALAGGGTEAEQVERQAAVRAELQRPDPARKMRYQVVEFYNGGRYARYGYQRSDDIRLVFAPESGIAFFGGDPDNFTYPRYNLDVSFFRAYDAAGKPLRPANHLRWSPSGAAPGDLIFTVGTPGRTQRFNTVAQLAYARDVAQPAQLAVLRARRDVIHEIARRDPARGLELRDDLQSVENSIKSIAGQNVGLRDPMLFARKVAFERDLRAAVTARPELQSRYGSLWDELAALQTERAAVVPTLSYSAYARSGPLGIALNLVRAADDPRAATAVMRANLPSETEQEIELATLLATAERGLGRTDAGLVQTLAGRTPEVAAREIVAGFTLADTTARRAFLQGGAAAVARSTDPVIGLARQLSGYLAEKEAMLSSVATREQVRVNGIGRAYYEVHGTTRPPDATSTLRITDGIVRGYESAGTVQPPFTTFFGLYNRYLPMKGTDGFELPARWRTPPAGLDLSTPFNFAVTTDTYGGNSGSPMINREMEVIGINFDRNVEALPRAFLFDDAQGRSVGLHSAGIVAALRSVYGAGRLVDELLAAPTRGK